MNSWLVSFFGSGASGLGLSSKGNIILRFKGQDTSYSHSTVSPPRGTKMGTGKFNVRG